MAEVTVKVNGRAYALGCDEGEQEHLRDLAEFVDSRARQIAGQAGAAGEARLLLMTALMIADDLADAYDDLEGLREELVQARAAMDEGAGEANGGQVALDRLAQRIEHIAARLESA